MSKRWTTKYQDRVMGRLRQLRRVLAEIDAVDGGVDMPAELKGVHDSFFALQEEIVKAIQADPRYRGR